MRVEAICGNCRFFDKNLTDGSPVGEIEADGKKVLQGLCRTNKGLLLKTRQETSICNQPPIIFQPVESKSPQASPEMI